MSSIVISDLEMVHSLDTSQESMYSHMFSTTDEMANHVIPMFQHTYTTDVSYLLHTQQLIENMEDFRESRVADQMTYKKINDNWKHIKHEPKFLETYGYLEWDMLKEYNTNSVVLQSITVTNMLSPVMSFILPFLIIFIFSFII